MNFPFFCLVYKLIVYIQKNSFHTEAIFLYCSFIRTTSQDIHQRQQVTESSQLVQDGLQRM